MVQVILGSAYINKCTIVIVNNSSNNIIKTITYPSKQSAKAELKRMSIKSIKEQPKRTTQKWRTYIVQC